MPAYQLRPLLPAEHNNPVILLWADDDGEAVVQAMIHAGPYGSALYQADRLVGWVDELGNFVDAADAPAGRKDLH